jgi:hypothetical protein
VTLAQGCRIGSTAYVALRASIQPYAGVNFIPPVKDYEFFGYISAFHTSTGQSLNGNKNICKKAGNYSLISEKFFLDIVKHASKISG